MIELNAVGVALQYLEGVTGFCLFGGTVYRGNLEIPAVLGQGEIDGGGGGCVGRDGYGLFRRLSVDFIASVITVH